ncbi:PAS domain S-box protein [Flavobacterium sp. NG2]|uniref:PAS domain S-box protein n=1 Tax=Flavobacterium sp. NG2 TaxID=3097547 RepID=UPI002A802BBA|nr:PAS domain S-box protein [Flavobacterium sp. NG2]WPR72762.1 PAS domain S-box protein [Flavobacterium sp. NG2]
MKKPQIPLNEEERIAELNSYNIIGELESEDYDFLTQMAAQICDTKISLISLITEDKQWFLSHYGLKERETPKELAFCAHAINQPKDVFIIEDATIDERFHDNPLVTEYPKVIFYAGMPLVTENGLPLGTLCVIDDNPKKLSEKQITSLKLLGNQVVKLLELRKKTFELNEQNNELQKVSILFNESQRINKIGAWDLDLATNKSFWTDEVYNIHEVPNDMVYDKSKGIEFYHPEDRHIILDAIDHTIATGEDFDVVCRFITAKNNFKWVRSSGKAWKENGKITKLIGTFQDITERKESLEKLRINEEAFRGNFEHAAIGMALLNEKGQWLKVNKRLCEILGYTEEEFLKLTFQDITHPEDLSADLKLLKETIQGKRESYTMEKRYIHKNGKPIYIILAVSLVKNSEGGILYLISQIVDITAQKVSEMQLANTIAYNEAIMEASTQVAIIGTDINGIITTFNEGAEQLLGYDATELIKKETPQIIHIQEEIEKASKALFEETGKKIEGIEVFVYKVRTGKAETKEWTYKRKDGTTFPVLLSMSAIRENNEITGFLGIATDITQMKQVENEILTLLEIAETQNERLKNFAYIVSHNLRSHSGGISSLIDLIESEFPDFSQTEYFSYLKKSSINLSETIKHLTEVVQINLSAKEKLQTVSLNPVIENNISSLITQARNQNITIINEVEQNTSIRAIPAYLDSVIMNFITNAIKYSSNERDSFLKIQTDKTDKYVVLKFIDNGLGIDLKKHGNKLFGMYKTFHNHADSRGIGLFITKNQIESMNGKIEVESKVNIGTTFKIYLEHEKN